MARQIVLDTETTGLKPTDGHRMIELGCIELVNRQFTGNHFHYYFNPERKIDRGAEAVHGISLSFLQDKPKFIELVDDFINYIEGAELIIHNAPFDLGFLNNELKLVNHKITSIRKICHVIDTLPMARKLHPGQKNNLDALCRRYEIDNSNRELHGALLDSELLARVYLAMTGGQSNLFADESGNASRQKLDSSEGIQNILLDPVELPVILASESELKDHHQQLDSLAKNSDAEICLWKQLEEVTD